MEFLLILRLLDDFLISYFIIFIRQIYAYRREVLFFSLLLQYH